MKVPKWKNNQELYSSPVTEKNGQLIKEMNYKETYVTNFLDDDPIRDWESINGCKLLWSFLISELNGEKNIKNWTVLDVGTKDCQFPEMLNKADYIKDALGIEIADSYIEYAKSKNRPIMKGDACDLPFKDNSWDIVFSHHLLGLVKDNKKALEEMLRVSKKYVITLANIPGNPKKHYSYIRNLSTVSKWLEEMSCEVLYVGKTIFCRGDEKVIFLKKLF